MKKIFILFLFPIVNLYFAQLEWTDREIFSSTTKVIFDNWKERGEFENNEAYQSRMTEENVKPILQQICRIYFERYITQNKREFQNVNIGKYDADNERFKITFRSKIIKTDSFIDFSGFVNIPVSEAPGFKTHHSNIFYTFYEDLGLSNDYIVPKIMYVRSMNDKVYPISIDGDFDKLPVLDSDFGIADFNFNLQEDQRIIKSYFGVWKVDNLLIKLYQDKRVELYVLENATNDEGSAQRNLNRFFDGKWSINNNVLQLDGDGSHANEVESYTWFVSSKMPDKVILSSSPSGKKSMTAKYFSDEYTFLQKVENEISNRRRNATLLKAGNSIFKSLIK